MLFFRFEWCANCGMIITTISYEWLWGSPDMRTSPESIFKDSKVIKVWFVFTWLLKESRNVLAKGFATQSLQGKWHPSLTAKTFLDLCKHDRLCVIRRRNSVLLEWLGLTPQVQCDNEDKWSHLALLTSTFSAFPPRALSPSCTQ